MNESLAVSTSEAAAAYALDLCARIAACTDTPGQITRLFLSPATRDVHDLLRVEMEALGMQVRVDAAGNLRGVYPAASPDAGVLLLASHLDSVPNAGAYDGVLGIALPLAAVRALDGLRLPYALEVIAFSEEEGVRFRMPFIGSRALVGTLGAADLVRRDAQGLTVEEAIRAFGLDPTSLDDAVLTPRTFAYVEVHIEQGPVLESLNLPLGIVTAIVGQTRLEVTFTGGANHAGTTPMPLRQDALAAAAEWITAVEGCGRQTPGLVATVGSIVVTPNAANVIPGTAVLSLDVRHESDRVREQAVAALVSKAGTFAGSRGVSVSVRETMRQTAVAMDPQLCRLLGKAVQAAGIAPHRMISGAGHDAMIVASRVPSAMLFLRTPQGLSHHPDEAVLEADVQAAVQALSQFLAHLESL